MKKILLLMLPLLALTLNSCSKDDGGDDGGNSSGKLVKQLTVSNTNSDEATYYFEYDNQQRTSKVTIDAGIYGSETFNITYSSNTITATEDERIFVYTLNSEGYVVKFERHGDYEDDEPYTDSETYTYNAGNWAKSTGDAWFFDANPVWQNGNIVQVAWDDGRDYTSIYTYNDKADKMNIVVIDVNDDILDFDYPFFISRFKGMTSKNLMSKKDYSREDEELIYTFDYTLDEDGYPTEIISKRNGEYDGIVTISYY